MTLSKNISEVESPSKCQKLKSCVYDIRIAALGYPELKSIKSRIMEDIERTIETSDKLRQETWPLVFDDPSDVVNKKKIDNL